MSNTPEVTNVIPSEQQDDVHREIATHINNGLQNQTPYQGGLGGTLFSLTQNLGSGGCIAYAIEGGLVSSLASKFGLPPLVTVAIAASLPGLGIYLLNFILHHSPGSPQTILQASL